MLIALACVWMNEDIVCTVALRSLSKPCGKCLLDYATMFVPFP